MRVYECGVQEEEGVGSAYIESYGTEGGGVGKGLPIYNNSTSNLKRMKGVSRYSQHRFLNLRHDNDEKAYFNEGKKAGLGEAKVLIRFILPRSGSASKV